MFSWCILCLTSLLFVPHVWRPQSLHRCHWFCPEISNAYSSFQSQIQITFSKSIEDVISFCNFLHAELSLTDEFLVEFSGFGCNKLPEGGTCAFTVHWCPPMPLTGPNTWSVSQNTRIKQKEGRAEVMCNVLGRFQWQLGKQTRDLWAMMSEA